VNEGGALLAARPQDVYRHHGIDFKQTRAVALFPEGTASNPSPAVEIEWTLEAKAGEREFVPCDFLINATGPKFNFGATEGLGPCKSSFSVCTPGHAQETSRAFLELVERMKHGERNRFVVGTGHGMCTCEGATWITPWAKLVWPGTGSRFCCTTCFSIRPACDRVGR
jgi:sulfide:quinone oxidoreductase